MKRIFQVGLLVAAAAAAVALAVPALAEIDVNAQLFSADDDVPGVALPASPLVGTLDGSAAVQDYDDVFAVPLLFNQRFDVDMTSTGAGTDFDLQLWKPGSPTIYASKPLSYIVQASSTEGTSTETFWYPASVTGTYSLNVVDWNDSAGPYDLTWSVVQLPEPQVTSRIPSTVKWGGGATIAGTATLRGVPLDRPKIMIASRRYGSKTWSYVNKERDTASGNYGMPRTVGSSTGTFSYRVYPTRLTEYRVIVWPTHDVGRTYGTVTLVSPRATITTPKAPNRVRAKRSFSIAGYLKPKHKVGARDVRLRCYSKNKNGSYTWRKTVFATNRATTKHPTYTRYTRTTSLPFKGTWKIVAYIPGDSIHTARTSNPEYVKVY